MVELLSIKHTTGATHFKIMNEFNLTHAEIRQASTTKLRKILKEDIIDKIYKVRLDAAHADIAGKTREVSLKELDKAMRLLKILFFRLANILVHVNREREKEGDC